jgi:hypothetical protein
VKARIIESSWQVVQPKYMDDMTELEIEIEKAGLGPWSISFLVACATGETHQILASKYVIDSVRMALALQSKDSAVTFNFTGIDINCGFNRDFSCIYVGGIEAAKGGNRLRKFLQPYGTPEDIRNWGRSR